MTTKRKPAKSAKPSPVSIRINGRPVVNAAGAKLAAASLGCVQTTGKECGQGNIREMLEYIGAGECLVQMTALDHPADMNAVSDVIDSIAAEKREFDPMTAETLTATAQAMRHAAKLREETY